uniref:Uncharacterized protein n=2 Tax=Anguilla anguilla TaxID=7936 RepID=A0A0E9X8H1_ANGAN
MLQFPHHLAVVRQDEDAGDASDSLLSCCSPDMWVIMESLFIQDGPFLMVRLLVLIHYQLFHLMLLFFTFKNFLVVILNLYRLSVICYDNRKGSKNDSY